MLFKICYHKPITIILPLLLALTIYLAGQFDEKNLDKNKLFAIKTKGFYHVGIAVPLYHHKTSARPEIISSHLNKEYN